MFRLQCREFIHIRLISAIVSYFVIDVVTKGEKLKGPAPRSKTRQYFLI